MAKIKLKGHDSGTGILTVTAPNTSTDSTITLPDSTATIATTTEVALKAPIASPEFTGNVGIGTSSQSYPLTIGDYTDSDEQLSFCSSSNATASIYFRDTNSSEGTYIKATGNGQGGDIKLGARYDNDNDLVKFELRKNTGVKVGIGTASPAQKLSLDSGYVQVGNGIGGAGGVKYPYSSANADCRNYRTRSDMVEYGDWGLEQSTTQSGETYSNKLRVSQAGDVIVGTGDLIFATANKGIVLGATTNVDANTLSDYEEGTWTPTGTNFTINSVASAKYTKIGRQVTAITYISGSGSGNSNNAEIKGLPFPSQVNGYSVGAVNITAGNPTSTNLLLRVKSNSTDMVFYKNNDTVVPATDVDSGHIILTITYFTDS